MFTTTINTKEIILDESLTELPLRLLNIEKFKGGICPKNHTIVRDCIPNTIRHNNYLHYLSIAWDSHAGIILSPDIVWHMILNELSQIINETPESFRELFSGSDDKIDILVQTIDPELLPLDTILIALNKLVPSNTDWFLPEFSTTTESSKFAMRATFMDAMSPYYNYGMYMCGIRKIKVLGEEEDWNKIKDNLEILKTIFISKDKNLKDYFNKLSLTIQNIIQNFINPEVKFWKNIFELERCGSGGQVEVKGWITDFYFKIPPVKYVENFSSNISYLKYKNISTNKKYQLISGLFSSYEEDGYIVPDFGYLIAEEKND